VSLFLRNKSFYVLNGYICHNLRANQIGSFPLLKVLALGRSTLGISREKAALQAIILVGVLM